METTHSEIHTVYGDAEVIVCRFEDGCCIPVLYKKGEGVPIVRIQSECFLGTVFASTDCDCGVQVERSLEYLLKQQHAVFIYMTNQEARGHGLYKKIGILANYQKTHNIEWARMVMDASEDMRTYDKAIEILKYLQFQEIILMTKDMSKIREIEASGINIIGERGMLGIE